MIHYLNGKFVKDEEAKISVFDLIVLRGYGVFDFLRTYNQRPFLLREHLERLKNSAKIIGLKFNFKLERIEKIVQQLLRKNILKNKKQEFNLRIILTGGVSKDSLTPGRPQLIILVSPVLPYPERYYLKGIKLISVKSQRILAEAKSINYLFAVKELQKAKKEGGIEILYLGKGGKILEAATSNFFAVKNDKILTPKLDKEILPGITRKVVIDLAKKLKIPVFEKNLYYREIKNFDEAFLTASNKEIMPVREIDNIKIKNSPGKITKILMEEFKKLTLGFVLDK